MTIDFIHLAWLFLMSPLSRARVDAVRERANALDLCKNVAGSLSSVTSEVVEVASDCVLLSIAKSDCTWSTRSSG